MDWTKGYSFEEKKINTNSKLLVWSVIKKLRSKNEVPFVVGTKKIKVKRKKGAK